jgi:hypothetical protein
MIESAGEQGRLNDRTRDWVGDASEPHTADRARLAVSLLPGTAMADEKQPESPLTTHEPLVTA